MKRIYYFLKFTQLSPLRLGNGGGEDTDSDLKTDGRGLPYIPGSSLAGVLRSGFSKEKGNALFGNVDIAKSMQSKSNEAIPSRLLISSAELKPGADSNEVMITVRDGVGLDDWGLTINKAKYDFQVAETMQPYYAVIEWSGNADEEKAELTDLFEPYLYSLTQKGISFGARTSRGYGAMKLEVRKKIFSFPEQLDMWLDYNPMKERFDMENQGESLAPSDGPDKGRTEIEIRFVMRDSFNIRVRTSRLEALPDGSIPDSVPLMNANGRPVIPGTAWAGAFRHHMHRLLRESGMRETQYENEINRLDFECFGMSSDKQQAHKLSNIRFSETEILGGKDNTIMRNAVDRFTAAPKNTGLFTNQVWTGGEGILRVTADVQVKEKDIQLLELVIKDMGIGLFSIGGEAGIGRGMMQLCSVSVDGTDRTGDFVAKEYLYSEE